MKCGTSANEYLLWSEVCIVSKQTFFLYHTSLESNTVTHTQLHACTQSHTQTAHTQMYAHAHAHIHTHTHTHTHAHTHCTLLISAAFAAEFHKMAAVVNGLAQCFAMENKDCKASVYSHTHVYTHTHTSRARTHKYTHMQHPYTQTLEHYVYTLSTTYVSADSKPLTDAISQTGETLRDIGQMHAEQVN